MRAAHRLLDKFSKRLDWLAPRICSHVPFTGLNTAWRSLDKEGVSILDVGCGRGQPMESIARRKDFFTIGADIHLPYLKACQQRGIHSGYVLCDVRMLPFRPKSFDIVLCLEVVEHLEKEDGGRLITEIEQIARKQVIISTPKGRYEQQAFDDNPHQEHKSSWSCAELKQLGYKVRGHGLPIMCGNQGLFSRLPKPMRPLGCIAWCLPGPVVYFFPRLAVGMVCTKRLVEFAPWGNSHE